MSFGMLVENSSILTNAPHMHKPCPPTSWIPKIYQAQFYVLEMKVNNQPHDPNYSEFDNSKTTLWTHVINMS